MPSHPRAALVSVLLALHGGVATAALSAPTPFTTVIRENFDAWDRDHNGTLSPEEIDALTVDGSITGERAAAVAAMKLVVRSTKVTAPPLTRALLLHAEPAAKGKPANPDADDPWDGSEDEVKKLDMAQRYARALRKIQGASHVLFVAEGPATSPCHQGPLGDCYFVSMAGDLALQRPDEVRTILHQQSEGGITTVTFPGKQPVQVARLTDAQLAISSTAGKNGLWLPIMEHALGSVRQRTRNDTPEEPTDLIAHGGSAGASIELLTGHAVARVGVGSPPGAKKPAPPAPKPDKPDAADQPAKPVADTPPTELPPVLTAEQIQERVPKMRDAVAEALSLHRLVGAGTGKNYKLPPGVSPNHAYAIVGFDRDADTIEIWNPHGNTFKPKGPPGIDNGYPTSAGRFTMPMLDFARIFRGVVYETDKKPEPTPRKSTEPKKKP